MAMRVRGVRVWVAALLLLGFGPVARAQEKLDPQQLQKAYDDALTQLKAAQERKNQLAAENEKLTAQVAELQKQVGRMTAEVDQSRRADAEHADKTFFLRSHYAAWQVFIRQYPEFHGRWKAFFGTGSWGPSPDLPDGIDVTWPPDGKGEADF